MVIFPGKVLENDNFILENKTSRCFFFFMIPYLEL